MRFYVENTDQEVEIKPDCSLLEHLIQNDIEISHSCGGMGSCGTCRVLIISGSESLPPRNAEEQQRATDLQFQYHERLACQICPIQNLTIKIP